jgi:outer membrane protein TolC
MNYQRNQSAAGQLLLNQNYGPFVNVGMIIPIYNGGNIKRREQVAHINADNAKIQEQQILVDYNISANKTFAIYSSTINQFITQKNTCELSKQLVDLMLQKFQLSSATLIELREAQKSLEDASYQLINISYAAKLAEVELLRIGNMLAN